MQRNEVVCLHALYAHAKVAANASPPINPFRLVEPFNSAETRFCAFYFVTGPRSTMICRMFLYLARMGACFDSCWNCDLLEELLGDLLNLLLGFQGRK